jgi:hypothetical protein
MIIALKFVVSCDVLGLTKKIRVIVLTMHYLRLINML